MKLNEVKCPICGTVFEGGTFDDCPYCDWERKMFSIGFH